MDGCRLTADPPSVQGTAVRPYIKEDNRMNWVQLAEFCVMIFIIAMTLAISLAGAARLAQWIMDL